MSGLIHFSSGKTLEITELEFNNMPVKLNGKGIKVQKTAGGHLIPLNSMTMEYIEYVQEEEDQSEGEIAERTREDSQFEPELPEMKEQLEKPKAKTGEEIMAEMIAKSDCDHKGKLVLYRQHTAKGIRYFPRCTFSGKRERYVSESKIVKGEYKGTPNETWTESDIADAIDWLED